MSDDTQVEQAVPEVDDKDSVINDLKSQLDALRGKTDELLSETKRAKQKARDEAEAKEAAKREKAKKEGDFEQLLKSSEKERADLSSKLQDLQNRISSEKVKNESMKLASDLADGPNAELLSEFISKRLRYTDEGVKVLADNGELTVSTMDQLKQEFTMSDKYKALLRGNKANGGGASGSGNSDAAGNKVMLRSTFDKMNPFKQADFIKSGGSLTDTDV